MNGRKAKQLRRIQTERRMVSLASGVPVTDSSAVCESVYNWVKAARKAYDLSHITFVFPMIRTLSLPGWFDPVGAVAGVLAKRLVIRDNDFCRPVASSENVTEIFAALIVAHRCDVPQVRLIHFVLFGRSIHQLLCNDDAPLAYSALKRS